MASKFKRTAKDLNNSVASTPMKPSPKVLKVKDEEESKLGKILEEIAQMNRKLDKLETIEGHLTRVDNDIKELKESYTFVNNTADELIKSRNEHSDLIKSLEKKVATIEAHTEKLQSEIVDIRARSMRSNLVLYNLPEKEKEDPFKTVRDLFSVKMKIDENQEIEIERAHRIEGKRDDGKPRPIVVKFLRYQDKEYVRKSAYLLKGTRIGIAEQFPKEIAETRKRLYPIMKKAKQDGNTAKLVKDKLYINGQRYRGPF